MPLVKSPQFSSQGVSFSAVRESLAGQGVSSWSGGATFCFAKETLTNVQCSNDSLLHPHKFVTKERSKCHLKPPHERKLVQMHVNTVATVQAIT